MPKQHWLFRSQVFPRFWHTGVGLGVADVVLLSEDVVVALVVVVPGAAAGRHMYPSLPDEYW